jgi:hypothetical protein
MAGIGRYKMTDALPPEPRIAPDPAQPGSGWSGRGKGNRKKPAGKGGAAASRAPSAEQVREAGENAQAKDAEASPRDRMVDIGRGNQQAGRQRAK